ncbi:(5-formylfuran-3-yl)methyl phosphate transaminase [Candidatus Bilamarchaeum dharawalense]|uniref:Aminotransferase n=1 Tax=Candidatus Bilamarchaeum dharawalense TaxID=2885759 RepID=A0A5E4LPB7_9ARCH|nr:(5-formylfuran-3-yl)methyl phosphate transaminase [Candidatus Bilamarchaeum dharawalense]
MLGEMMVDFYDLAEKALAMERAGKKVIRLNVGDTNLPTPRCAVDAAINSISTTKAGYGPAAGLEEFRKKIAEREKCKIENVVVGPGVKALLFGLLSIIGKKRVFLPKPYWPAFEMISKKHGLQIVPLETTMETNWEFEIPKLTAEDAIIICNPLNPTSTVYDEELIRKTIKKANEVGAEVILDETYKGLVFKEIPGYENAIRLRSFSKEFSMEGWRLGYAVAPKEIVDKITKFNQITITCVPQFIQKAGLACLENEKGILQDNRKIWMERTALAQKMLAKTGFEFAKPNAGMYIFVTHPKITDGDNFAEKLLEQGVVVAPGSEFGCRRFVRICTNKNSVELEDAINKIVHQLTHL